MKLHVTQFAMGELQIKATMRYIHQDDYNQRQTISVDKDEQN